MDASPRRYPIAFEYLRITTFTIVFIGVFLLMVWARAFYGSVKSYEEGEVRMERGEYVEAVTFFDRSLHWYAPFNPYLDKSAHRLWQISKLAEEKGDIRLAIIAAKTLRRGFISARSFYIPGKEWIKRCDERIYRLLITRRLADGNGEKSAITKSPILDDLQVKGPDVFWTFVTLAGLLGWIGSTVCLIALGSKTAPKRSVFTFSNLKWVIFWAVFFALWILGMMKA